MAMTSARTVLIAGAGDVGGRLAALRAALGDDVIALRRRDAELSGRVRSLRVDLVTGEGFERLPRRPDAVVYCAAPDRRDESAYRALFVDGLRRLLDRVDAERFLFVSSTAVYSEDAGEWIDEATPARPSAFNGRVLLEAEHELAAHGEAAVLRLSGLYGPGRTALLERARSGASPRPRWSNRIHVEDAAAALSHLLDLGELQTHYLGNDDLPALESEVIAWVRRHEGREALSVANEAQSGRRVSNARLRIGGWAPRFPDYASGYLPLLAKPGV
ncbi:NAD-dependent epimerase/dehydratase family protein [Arenimonas sp.]|uniref:NAD-dependent epimerase/dehydratase family protein n=1 Tax=Arenimonas sp. TaxID=1872635 RepID=UPI0039E4A20F